MAKEEIARLNDARQSDERPAFDTSTANLRDTFFDDEIFGSAWQAFLKHLRESNGSPLHASVLEKCDFRLDGTALVLLLPNPAVQEPVVEAIRPTLLGFLRDYLKNDGITLEKEVVEAPRPMASGRQMTSQEEKFKKMADKNPWLAQLQKELGLRLK